VVDVIEEQNNNVRTEENNVSNEGESSAESSGNDSNVSKASVYDELFSDDED